MTLSPQTLTWIAAAAAGGSALSFGVAVMHVVKRQERREPYVPLSLRRRDLRRKAMGSTLFRTLLPLVEAMSAGLGRFDIQVLREYIEKPYARAGSPGGLEVDEVVAMAALLGGAMGAFFSFFFLLLLGPVGLVLGIMGVPLGFLGVVSSLKTRGEIRHHRFSQAMPYVLDLLVLTLRSGTSLTIALGRVVEDYKNHPVGDELGQVLAEIQTGLPRRQAFVRLAERFDTEEMLTFVDTVNQAEELGWPLAETLERFADRQNTQRILNAQDKAGAAGVLVMLPSTLVLASAILLLFGPTIVRLMLNGTSLN